MNTVLTAAGIALCTTLLGNPNPSFNDCEVVIYRSQPPADYFFKSPVLSESCPDDRQDCEAKNWPNCIAWATYDILDGSKGTMYLCHKDARLIWLPDGRWSWKFDDKP